MCCSFFVRASSYSPPTKTLFLRLRFYRQACRPPCIEPTDQRMDVPEAVLFEYERHPGARVLLRSSTVNDRIIVTANVRDVFFRFVRRDAYRSAGFYVGCVPRIGRTRIDDRDILSAPDPFRDFVSSYLGHI